MVFTTSLREFLISRLWEIQKRTALATKFYFWLSLYNENEQKNALIIFETLNKSSLRQYFIANRSKFVLIDLVLHGEMGLNGLKEIRHDNGKKNAEQSEEEFEACVDSGRSWSCLIDG